MLPNFKTSSRVAFIDDEAMFLHSLLMCIPSRFASTFHVYPKSLDVVLNQAKKKFKLEQAKLVKISEVQADGNVPVIPLALEYFADPARFDATSVLVADFHMPAEGGVSICSRHAGSGLQRILLTGVADNEQAIEAFNHRAIDMFLPKQSSKLREKLLEAIEAQQVVSAAHRGSALQRALPSNLVTFLAAPVVSAELHTLLMDLKVIEYMALGAPQGLLAVTQEGNALWIQLEDEQSMAALLEGLDEQDWAPIETTRVAERKAFVNQDMAAQLCQPAQIRPAITISETPYFGAAVFQLEGLPENLVPARHSGWLDKLPSASVAY
jgi:CheY-like chemotaxis protein